MRKLYSLLFSIIFIGSSFAQVPTNGLVAEWKFTAGTVTDSVNMVSGSAQLGAVSTSDRFGHAGNAYDLPPAGYLTFGDLYDNLTVGTNGVFSFSFWVKFDVIDGTARYIIGKAAFEGNCSLAGRQFVIGVNANNRVEAQLFGALTGGHKRFQSSGSVTAGQWMHIVVGVQMSSLIANSNSVPVMYINGVAQTVTSNETVGGGLSANGMDNGSAFFSAGRYNNNQGNPCATTQYLDGQFDDLRVYDRMLGSDDALALYNEAAPAGCADPVINSDLSNATYLCPGFSSKTVTVDASGDGLTYQWQSSPNMGAWTDLGNDPQDNFYDVDLSANYYRVIITSDCGSSVTSTITQVLNANANSVTIGGFSPGTGTICAGQSVTISTQVAHTSTFQWEPATGTGTNNYLVSPTETTTYTVTATSIFGCVASTTATVTVNVPEPIISENMGTLQVTGGNFFNVQWYLEGNPISGANNYSYTPTADGNYTVSITENGCSGTSDPYAFTGIATGINGAAASELKIYPNPFNSQFVIEAAATTTITIINTVGEIVLSKTINGRTSINATNLSAGIYFVREETSGAVMKLVKN